MLEQRLEEIDCKETRPLFLARADSSGNWNRESVLREIDINLADYGMIRVERPFLILMMLQTNSFRELMAC